MFDQSFISWFLSPYGYNSQAEARSLELYSRRPRGCWGPKYTGQLGRTRLEVEQPRLELTLLRDANLAGSGGLRCCATVLPPGPPALSEWGCLGFLCPAQGIVCSSARVLDTQGQSLAYHLLTQVAFLVYLKMSVKQHHLHLLSSEPRRALHL